MHFKTKEKSLYEAIKNRELAKDHLLKAMDDDTSDKATIQAFYKKYKKAQGELEDHYVDTTDYNISQLREEIKVLSWAFGIFLSVILILILWRI